MRKLLYAVSGFIFCALLFISCKGEREQRKETITKDCIQSGDKQFAEPELKKIYHEYCECFGQNVSEKLTKAEWAEFEKMTKQGKEAELQTKLQPIMQPCLDKLQAKMAQQAK